MRGICVRGEVATGGWDPRSELMDAGLKDLIIDPFGGFKYLGAAGGRKKELRFFEPVEEMCRQVVARKKGMSTCRPVHSLKDYALSLRSFLTPPQTG